MRKADLDTLSNKCRRHKQLYNVLFVLLSACNHKCVHCYIPEHNCMGLDLGKIKQLIQESRQLGALNITLTGGEIFLRPDIFDIINYARDAQLRVFLMSNAYSLNEETVVKLKQLAIAEFSTTLFSINPRVHDSITQCQGSCEKVIENIKLLRNYDIPLTIKTPLMESNKYEYKEVEEFASIFKAYFMDTTTIFSKSVGDSSLHNLSICEDLNNIVADLCRLQKKYRKDDLGYNKRGIPCGAGFNSIAINYDGIVYPCNSLFLPVGDVNYQSLSEIWVNSTQLNKWREESIKPLMVCKKCNLKKSCLRCPGMALLEDGNLFGCSSSAKKLAEIKKEVR